MHEKQTEINLPKKSLSRRSIFIVGLPLLFVAIFFFLISPARAAISSSVISMVLGEKITLKCPDGQIRTTWSRRPQRDLSVECVKVATVLTPTATQTPTSTLTPTPTTHGHGGVLTPTLTLTPTPTGTVEGTGSETPVAGTKCPSWVHDRYVTTGPDGKSYKTWHAPSDPEFGCWFGHEHGSDPSAFPFVAQTGKPAFGYTAMTHGMTEPHEGFKVYVVDDSERGLWWMSTFHMGTSGVKRAFEPMHTHDMVVTDRSGNLLTNVHLMADTGGSFPKCRESNPSGNIIPGSGTPASKAMPTSDCTGDAYEAWGTIMKISDIFSMENTFDVDNGITALKRLSDGSYSQTETVFSSTFICSSQNGVYLPNQGPSTRPNYPYYDAGDCNRTGDKRGYRLPHLTINNNTGNADVWTDAMGNILPVGQGIRQYISTSVKRNDDQTYGWRTPVFSNYDRYNKGNVYTYYNLDSCNLNFCGPYNMAGNSFTTFPN